MEQDLVHISYPYENTYVVTFILIDRMYALRLSSKIQLYLGPEQVKKQYINEDVPSETTFLSHWKSMKDWEGRQFLHFVAAAMNPTI